jgi:hypothetical protein
MNNRSDRAAAYSPRVGATLVIAALGVAAAGCAPDAYTNRQATGFNGYLKTISVACYPLQIGSADVGEWLRQLASNDPNYPYFLDMTSKLYYNRISPDEYRSSITGFLGAGSSNDRSFNCMFNNLPPNRPNAPPE